MSTIGFIVLSCSCFQFMNPSSTISSCINRKRLDLSSVCLPVTLLLSPQYRVSGLRPGMGWLWFWMFRHVAELPSQLCQIPIWSAQAELGRQWNTDNEIIPNRQTRWDTLYCRAMLCNYRVSHPIGREVLPCFVLWVPLPCLGSS